MSTFDFSKAKAAALKILGKDGDVPDPPAPIQKALDSLDKTFEAFDKAQDTIKQAILDLENSNDEMKNALKQFQATLEKSDLGLNSKNKDDAKKIAQAQKILVDRIATGQKNVATNAKDLDELDKHVIQLGKYKPSTH